MFTPDSPDGASVGLLTQRVEAVVDERRSSRRLGRKVKLTLSGLGSTNAFGCVTEDISEGGLYIRVPASVGLSVGNRVEVQFGDEAGSSKPSRFRGETCFATVIRTKIHRHEPTTVLGAGLRFDQPLYL